ncbi:MAG: DUF2490 domain-containing protein [Myxococcota bacterium]|jgi:hypothetical protein|nr:DUF2490 domain-containing protein [Myxococcota bacterium]
MTRNVPWVLLALTTTRPALAEDDTQLWTTAGVRVELTDDLRTDLSQEIRLDQAISRTESVLTQLTTTWSIEKWLRLASGYRISREKNNDDRFETKHRLHVQGSLRSDIGPLTLSYRLWFQDEMEADEELEFTPKLRNRIKAEYDTTTSLSPGLMAESFTLLEQDERFTLEKLRLTGGMELQPDGPHSFEVFYRLQVPMEDPGDPLDHIIGLEYQYQAPRNKDESQEAS